MRQLHVRVVRWLTLLTAAIVALASFVQVAQATPNATPVADLSVTLTASPQPVLSGNTISYVAVLTNNGPGPAADAQMALPVLQGSVFEKVVSSTGSCRTPAEGSAGIVMCSFGKLSPASGQNVVRVKLLEQVRDLQGVTRGEAKVHTASSDPNSANDLARLLTTVKRRDADLSLQMAAPPQAVVGSTITYTLTAHNAGPYAAIQAGVADRIPVGTVFESAATSQGKCLTPAVGGSGIVRCVLGRFGHQANNDTATITIVVNETADGGTIHNLASIFAANTTDGNKANNAASADTKLINGIVLGNPASTDLGVMVSGPPRSLPYKNITFTIAVSNVGPDQATDVGLSSAVPNGTTFVSATPSQGTCSTPAPSQTGTIACDVGDLPALGSATVRLTVYETVGYGVRIADTASAVHNLNDVDPTPLDETNSLSIPIDSAVQIVPGNISTDVSISDSVANSYPNLDAVTNTVAVTNNGPIAVSNVQFTVSFAKGVLPSLAATKSTQGSCSQVLTTTSDVFNCSTGSLADGASATFKIPTTVNEGVLKKDKPNLLRSQLFGSAELSDEELPPVTKGVDVPMLLTETIATVTGVSGAMEDNPANNVAFIDVEPPPTVIVSAPSKPKCKNQDLGRLAALLQMDCNSPLSKVDTWAATLAAVAAAGIGNAALATIVFYTVEVVAVAAENGYLL